MSNLCYHCGDPIPAGLDIASELQNQRREFCCFGCQAIAEHICGADLSLYYERRDNSKGARINEDNSPVFALLSDKALYDQYVHQGEDGHVIQVSLTGITCSACAWLIEKHLSQQQGVLSVHVNLSSAIATITWNPAETNVQELAKQLLYIGYVAQPYLPGEQDTLQRQEKKRAIIRLGIAGVGMMQVMMSAIAMYAGDLQGMDDIYRQLLRWISFIFATPVVIYAGLPFYRGALRDLKNRHFTMDLPVSIGVLLAYASSVLALYMESGHVYFDSVTMFIFFLLLGRFLEAVARSYHVADRHQAPLTAVKVVKDQTESTIPLQQLQTGDVAIIEPGQTFPVDGILLSDFTSVDESSLTGEYTPVTKQQGANIHAQTVNVDQQVQLQVTEVGQNTKAAAISRITERALGEKPRVAIIADKVAHYFVIAILITASLTYGFWSWMGEPEAYWIMVSVLVVTCPCALSLATPVALTTVTNALKGAGFLITRGHVIEALAKTQHIVFDKTGTLTYGSFSITQIELLENALSSEQALTLISGLEQHSKHPIAKTFQQFAPASVSHLQNLASQGVTGIIHGDTYYFGNQTLMESLGLRVPASTVSGKAQLELYLATASQLLAKVTLCDILRPEARTVIESLRQQGIRVSLLTGDTLESAHSILEPEWFDDFKTSCLPDQKWQWLQAQDSKDILMVGDGLNDVPALAGATTSLAMGASSDLAKLHSDAILLSEHLSTIPTALKAAKRCRQIIQQNLIWAAGYNATLLPLAIAGWIPPWVAAIGMALSSLIVVVNATRLNKL
ncbi:putative copper-importing P-type ATPase A [Marinomonas aquimarina]|uniref:Putative copper-importing P-type ATPase A n=1 Tax=Marinomonas aquimarina TaxID=295068 RepID=A0A1A8TI15_9GAMM|nr:heavy metal translocating P-type ATPase [Marinomonas aquimarina]SBS32030.1 putative copper-importing P-type ATPase A [Marinomonas aquimarina]